VTIDELLATNALFLFGDISSIVAAALAVVFVQRATSREEERARLVDLIPDDDRTPILRRKSTWVVIACLAVAVALQGGIAVASWSGSLSSESPSESEPAPGTPAGALVSDNFSTQGGWLVQDDADLTFEYVSGGYHIHLKKPGLLEQHPCSSGRGRIARHGHRRFASSALRMPSIAYARSACATATS
jgi:hypothetical protein